MVQHEKGEEIECISTFLNTEGKKGNSSIRFNSSTSWMDEDGFRTILLHYVNFKMENEGDGGLETRERERKRSKEHK